MWRTMSSKLDFTTSKYDELCKTVAESGYTAIPLAGYLQSVAANQQTSCIILRHDIDRAPQRALDIALIENKYGLRATYYFRTSTLSGKIVDQIAACGHEIGFHYETLDKCKGNVEDAIDLFKRELAQFRQKYEVQTVCAHGNPLTRYDNKTIWKYARLSDFNLLGEAFLSLDFTQFAYFSDSGRTWIKSKSQKMPGKDDVITAFDYLQPESTDEIIRIINEGALPNICILAHCERWCNGAAAYLGRYLFDMACSCGKSMINVYRG